MEVLRCCIDMPTLSWRFKLDRLQPKSAVLVDADHVLEHCVVESQSTRQATVALSSDEFELFALNVGCVAVMLFKSCLKGMQLERWTLTGRPEIYSDSSSARGTTKRSGVARIKPMDTRHLWYQESLRKSLVRSQRDRHDAAPQPLKKDETARANTITTLTVADRISPPPTGERLTAPVFVHPVWRTTQTLQRLGTMSVDCGWQWNLKPMCMSQRLTNILLEIKGTLHSRQIWIQLEVGHRCCWNVVQELIERDAVGTLDVDGQTRDLLGLIVCQRNDEEVWSGANQTHGYATIVVPRELKNKFGSVST